MSVIKVINVSISVDNKAKRTFKTDRIFTDEKDLMEFRKKLIPLAEWYFKRIKIKGKNIDIWFKFKEIG